MQRTDSILFVDSDRIGSDRLIQALDAARYDLTTVDKISSADEMLDVKNFDLVICAEGVETSEDGYLFLVRLRAERHEQKLLLLTRAPGRDAAALRRVRVPQAFRGPPQKLVQRVQEILAHEPA